MSVDNVKASRSGMAVIAILGLLSRAEPRSICSHFSCFSISSVAAAIKRKDSVFLHSPNEVRLRMLTCVVIVVPLALNLTRCSTSPFLSPCLPMTPKPR
ncbi:uncharacterized protein BT62DRAFT_392751 [Guyanagaster necrorhizus]|uniref:Uncharacterized protein n=1 Tax=Guyanagaster necrorhizus TaxID=856835 RepID=A0A9P7W2L0_9AGAR|nr:uncharacterized protein BT62DRAFT_392751 [Guyanagaster necrorhizus MCA 3950]KAG7451032.1 hypothetical protein BT62DRAFT_392751 [Guyanagaster necrorhizus MCA 3950]